MINRKLIGDSRFSYLSEKDTYVTKAEEPEFKFNVIGAGIMGCEHIRVTELEGRASINGLYDSNPGSIDSAIEALKSVSPNQTLKIYKTLEEACTDPDVDGLIISTPNYSHLEVLKIAMKSGKHILLEKPMATTIKDAWEILQIAKEYKGIFQVGLQYRYKAIYVESIYESLKRQSIGKLKTISIQEHRIPFLDKVEQWNKFSKYSGGTLVEKCCHYFDLFNYFAGSRPKKVYSSGNQAANFKDFEYEGNKSDIIDNAFVIVEYENGFRANFNLCMFAPLFYEEIIICGDAGRIKAWEKDDFLSEEGLQTGLEIHKGEMKPSRISSPKYPKHIETTGHSGATFIEHSYWIDNIKGLKTDTATVSDGFWSVVVGYAAQSSLKTGMPVMINDLLKEERIDII
ncbi:MAG: Gfo/Idh/MocA family oxidoreductase [Spirochaetia bacterium]|jgi:myo-inositol 2-dehydrogenase/D-chiro-inositol 1-dehydrogenase|nr:Gfo/Idh/MocA family oxidoreductase [Spirochaetia bacterium]